MNRREFAVLLGMAPLVARAADHKSGTAGKPLVRLPGSARAYDIGRGEARILAGAEQSGGAWWFGSFFSEAGRKTSLHVHYSANEQFYVLEGILSLWADGRWQDLSAGALAVMPQGVPHALGNRSKHPVRFLASGDPAGFERFFPDVEALATVSRMAVPGFSPNWRRSTESTTQNCSVLRPKAEAATKLPCDRRSETEVCLSPRGVAPRLHASYPEQWPARDSFIAPAGLYDSSSP